MCKYTMDFCIDDILRNIPHIMHLFNKELLSWDQKRIFSNRWEIFDALHRSIECKFVSSLVVADVEEFFAGLYIIS